MSAFHPDLAIARIIPRVSAGPRSAALIRRLTRRRADRPAPGGTDVTVTEQVVEGPAGLGTVALRLFQPAGLSTPAPALLWIHGGGLILGAPEQDDRRNLALVRELGISVAAVRYRLAPDHPAPAAVEDCHAALLGLVAHAGEWNIDVDRIAVGGASAGGGLAAALTHIAHDRGSVRPALQLLIYPMLDDRTVNRTDLDTRHVRIWTPKSNRYGWTSYLATEPGSPEIPSYASAARRKDLSGLPPAWIGVGTLDLFYDEDIEYGRRLREANVACELVEVPGAFHGFDAVFANANVSKDFLQRQVRALQTALRTPD